MPKSFTTEAGYTPGDLVHFGNDHLVAARHLFALDNPQVLDSAGYLIHLGFELVLKAFLLHVQTSFPDDHDLCELIAKIESSGFNLDLTPEQAEAVRNLDKFFLLRYPRPAGLPEIGHPHWPMVEALFEAIGQAMPPELSQQITSIDHTRKGGRKLVARPKGSPAA